MINIPIQVQIIIWTNDDYFTDAYMRHSASMSEGICIRISTYDPWEMCK